MLLLPKVSARQYYNAQGVPVHYIYRNGKRIPIPDRRYSAQVAPAERRPGDYVLFHPESDMGQRREVGVYIKPRGKKKHDVTLLSNNLPVTVSDEMVHSYHRAKSDAEVAASRPQAPPIPEGDLDIPAVMEDWREHLTDGQRTAINAYTHDQMGKSVNTFLNDRPSRLAVEESRAREGELYSPYVRIIDHFDQMVADAPPLPEPVTLTRRSWGQEFDFLSPKDKYVHCPCYLSTTYHSEPPIGKDEEGNPRNHYLTINLPKGAKVIDTTGNTAYPRQRQMLVPRAAVFSVEYKGSRQVQRRVNGKLQPHTEEHYELTYLGTDEQLYDFQDVGERFAHFRPRAGRRRVFKGSLLEAKDDGTRFYPLPDPQQWLADHAEDTVEKAASPEIFDPRTGEYGHWAFHRGHRIFIYDRGDRRGQVWWKGHPEPRPLETPSEPDTRAEDVPERKDSLELDPGDLVTFTQRGDLHGYLGEVLGYGAFGALNVRLLEREDGKRGKSYGQEVTVDPRDVEHHPPGDRPAADWLGHLHGQELPPDTARTGDLVTFSDLAPEMLEGGHGVVHYNSGARLNLTVYDADNTVIARNVDLPLSAVEHVYRFRTGGRPGDEHQIDRQLTERAKDLPEGSPLAPPDVKTLDKHHIVPDTPVWYQGGGRQVRVTVARVLQNGQVEVSLEGREGTAIVDPSLLSHTPTTLRRVSPAKKWVETADRQLGPVGDVAYRRSPGKPPDLVPIDEIEERGRQVLVKGGDEEIDTKDLYARPYPPIRESVEAGVAHTLRFIQTGVYIVAYHDGERGIYRTPRATKLGVDPNHERWSALVARAAGFAGTTVPDQEFLPDGGSHQRFLTGAQTGTQANAWPENYVGTDAAVALGRYEYLVAAEDRHTQNWMVDDNDRVWGIDYEFTFEKGPLMGRYLTSSEFSSDIKDDPGPRELWEEYKEKLLPLEDEFAKDDGGKDAFAAMIKRIDYVIENGKMDPGALYYGE